MKLMTTTNSLLIPKGMFIGKFHTVVHWIKDVNCSDLN